MIVGFLLKQLQIPAPRTGELHELDGAVLLLASGAGSYVNGAVLAVDGGSGVGRFDEIFIYCTGKFGGFFCIMQGTQNIIMNTDAKKQQTSDPHIVESVKEFVEWVEQNSGGRSVLYRGIPNAKWAVESAAAQRMKLSDKKSHSFDEFVNDTVQLLERVRRHGHHVHNSQKMSDLELLGKLQHFGAATCLIDFTYNPLVALWFACHNKDKLKKNGKVIAIDPNQMNIIATDDADAAQNARRSLKLRLSFDRVDADQINKCAKKLLSGRQWIWDPVPRENRSIAQHSVFVFGKPQITDRHYVEVRVLSTAKENILNVLHKKFGVTEESVFGDFTGFAFANAYNKHYEGRSVDVYYEKARKKFGQKNFEKTKYYCDTVIGQDPGHDDAYHLRGLCKFLLKEYDMAITDFDQAIEVDCRRAETFLFRGVAYDRLRNPKKAISDYEKIIQIASDKGIGRLRFVLAWAYRRRAKIYRAQHEFVRAKKDMEKAFELDPDLQNDATN